jgi:L-lactate utilization protein LutC
MTARDEMLGRIREALGRSPEQPCAAPPPPRLVIPQMTEEERLERFTRALEALSGKVYQAASAADARRSVEALIAGKRAVASNSPFLAECGITGLPGVETGYTDELALRETCQAAEAGITSADYALADTGSQVLLSSPREARMISLLPLVHVAVVPRGRMLTGLDELFAVLPDPSALSSSMVIITGPSRTADIEQILVRGVHGPREVHVVLV